jgi:hypothetical protein
VEVEPRPEFAEVWPLIEEWGPELELPGWTVPPFMVREHDESTTEAELDLMVPALGPGRGRRRATRRFG